MDKEKKINVDENNRIIELMERKQELEAMLNGTKKQLEEKERQVRELQEHNQKLFLKVTSKAEESGYLGRKKENRKSKILDEKTWNTMGDDEKEYWLKMEDKFC